MNGGTRRKKKEEEEAEEEKEKTSRSVKLNKNNRILAASCR
jgi:hypothetical protein